MSVEKDNLEISQETYDWCLKTFGVVEKNFGINIHLHDDNDNLKDGQIFLFNHFARFETVIPPYLFYKEMGVFTRTIADHRLYKIEKLAKFMYGGGAVPNNMPGLLPFLAAEILRGRKVVIFPEGGMIKDRRVMDEDGKYRIFSHTKSVYRKHHRGAAVLALTLELFKQRIRDLFEKNDTKRLDHWCEALGIESHEELRKRINIKTTLIPGTITFNPIRITDNILSRSVKLLTKGKAKGFIEEMVVEGNILLRDTDMDIRLGDPIISKQKWNFWERFLLNRYFLSIKSLEEFFGLKDNAERWSERMLSKVFQEETDRIRDIYMEDIYKGITVNIGHLTSDLILSYVDLGIQDVPKAEFHRALYLTVKDLQADNSVHLHKNLENPEYINNLAEGQSFVFERFLKTAQHAGLVKVNKESYHLDEKLTHEHAYETVRKENPILVYANEIKPVQQVHNAIIRSMEKAKDEHSEIISMRKFDDELREHAWRKGKYSHPRYLKINNQETATTDGAPFLNLHKGKTKTGVVLVHGFSAMPSEMKPLADELYKAGYNVMGVRLAGHGTFPYDMESVSHKNWLISVENGYEIMSGFVDEVILVGFSTGGTLALNLAIQNKEKLKAIITICAPMAIQDRAAPFAPLANTFNKFTKFIPYFDGIKRFAKSGHEAPENNYKNFPIHGVHELLKLMRRTRKVLPKVKIPICIIQATEDVTVKAKSAEIIHKNITSDQKEIHWIDTEKHNIATYNIGNSWEIVQNYIESITK